MATEKTPLEIINIAKICQVLAITDRGFQNAVKGGILDERLPTMLYIERRVVEWVYNTNPGDPTLQGIANYLYSLCYPYAAKAQQIINNLAQSPPIITGPANQSGNVGFTAVFSVSVVSSLPVIYQWFDYLGNPILGATSSSYSLVNAQLVDSGKNFFVKATNAAGNTVSGTATLTVTVALTGSFAYMDIDPGPDLQANLDPFTYQSTFGITHNAQFVITLPGASTPNKYLVIRVPDTESSKGTWSNTPLNNGSIPDAVFQTAITFGGSTYYYTRVAVSMDTSATLILS